MRKLVLFLSLLLVLACADTVTEPQMALEISAAKVAQTDVGGPWVESITGSGHIVAPPFVYTWPDAWRTFTINAKKSADGSVDGRFQVIFHPKGHRADVVRFSVICFTIEGNTGWVGAHKEGNDPPDIAFQVVDYGEGSGDPPDEVGLYAEAAYWGFPAGFAQAFCDETPELIDLPGLGVVPLSIFRVPIVAGNIQIHTK
jgi:hypothetical protein